MPVLQGMLVDVTAAPSTASEVWVRAPRGRVAGTKVVVPETRRVEVKNGEFSVNIEPGPAYLVVVHATGPQEHVPLLVQEGMSTIAEAVRLGDESWADFTPSQADAIRAEIVASVAQARQQAQDAASSATAASKSASGAASSASQAEESAQAAGTSEKNAKTAESGAVAAQAGAEKSAGQAEKSASSAKTDAARASSSASSATESAEAAKNSEEVADQRATAADEAAKAIERVGTAQALGVEDLNDVTAQGVYSQDKSVNASTGRHYPVGRAGLLEVFNPPVGAQVYQRYTTYGDYQDVYVRGSQTGSWGSWKKLSQDGHTHGISDVVGLEARFATSPYNSITVRTEAEATALSGLRKGDYVHVLGTGNIYIWE